ncbi:MAG: MFS transporter [Acidobacteria bacterium]|nr:MFS transporter [Acidobacteriota bacterium]
MVALSVMSYIDRTAMSIAGPHIMKEFGLSETQMGSIYSAFILTYALLMAPGGRLADRFGPRLVLAWMSIGAAAFTALTASAGRIGLGILPSFLVIRLALGVCAAPIYPACARMTANWVAVAHHARVQGIILGGAPLGAAITPILFAWLIGRYGWRVSFLLAAVVTGALAFVWMAAVRDRPEGTRATVAAKRDPIPWGKLLADRNLVLLTLGYFCINYFEYIFFYWIYYYFGEIRKVGAAESAAYTTALLLTMMAMMPLGGWVSDRLIQPLGLKMSRRVVSVVGMVLSAVLLYAGTNMKDAPVMVTLLSLALGFAASAEGPFWASAIEAGGGESGAASGVMNGFGNVGGLVAPVLTPYIAQHAGWSWGLYFGSVVVLTGAVAWFFIDPTGMPQPNLTWPTRGHGDAETRGRGDESL